MVERFHPRLAVACSFQKEASVVLDLLLRIAPDARVFTLDTHVLFPETYETWTRVEERYGIKIDRAPGPEPRPPGRPPTATRCGCATPTPAATCARSGRCSARWPTSTPGSSGVRRDQAVDARQHARSSRGTRATSSGRPTRSPTGPRPTCGATSPSTTSRTTRCTIRATRRSAARTAPSPGAGRDGRWAGSGKTECGLHG